MLSASLLQMHHIFVLLQWLIVCGDIEANPGTVFSLTSKELFIFNLNIRSFRIKYIYLENVTSAYHVICVSETNLDSNVHTENNYIVLDLTKTFQVVVYCIYLSANRNTIWKWWDTKTFGWKYVCQIWKYTFVQYIDTRHVRILIGQTFYWKETQRFSTYLCLNKPNCGFKCWHIIIAKSYFQRYYIV